MEAFIAGLVALLGPLADMSRSRRELRDDALRAINNALIETNIYYSRLERGSERNFEAEEKLAKYWSAAAIPVRHIDPEFAEVCDNKAGYWLNPTRWSKEQIHNVGIELGAVQKRYRAQLRPSYSKAGKSET